MGSIVPLRKEEPMERASGLFAIPKWMFGSHPHLVSAFPEDLRYYCQVCGVIEPKEMLNGYIRQYCACERALLDAEKWGPVGRPSEDVLRSQITYTWLGTDVGDLERKSFADFSPSWQPKAYQIAKDYAANFISARQHDEQFSRNMLLIGGVGTGKTHLAAAALNELRAHTIPCLFAMVGDYFDKHYAADFALKDDLRERASTTPLLVLDDLSALYIKTESEDTYQKAELFKILNARYLRHLPTIITMNEHKDLRHWLSDPTIDRLGERCDLVQMNGKSYRRLRAEGQV